MARPSSFNQEIDKIEIYALLCPVTNEVRYIGKAKDSSRRLKSHMSDSKRRNTPVYCWIRSLSEKGLTPNIQVLTKTDDWVKEEIRLISEYKNKGAKLLNVAIGGDEPYCPKEIRAANGKKNSHAIHSDPKRKRLWKLKQFLAVNIGFLERNGRHEKVSEIKSKLLRNGINI